MPREYWEEEVEGVDEEEEEEEEEEEDYSFCEDDFYGEGDRDYDCDFADPGGNSSLRAATESNPRNLPCPTCKKKNRLTPADRRHGYQCDSCADRAERGWDY